MQRVLQSFLIAIALLVAAGCSSGSSGANRSAETSSSRTATTAPRGSSTTPADPKAAAQADLNAYWAMIKRLLAAPDPLDPELTSRAVDPALAAARDLLTTRQSTNQIVSFDGVPYHVDTTVETLDGDTARFSGCIVDGGRILDTSTGQIVNDKVSTSRITGSLENVAGTWKMQRFDVMRKVDGEVACADLA